MIIEASNAQDGDFLNRETYFDISDDRWQMKSERSFDDGQSWQKGRYEMVATRSGKSAN